MSSLSSSKARLTTSSKYLFKQKDDREYVAGSLNHRIASRAHRLKDCLQRVSPPSYRTRCDHQSS